MPDASLATLIDPSFTQHADRVALHHEGRRITYAELGGLVARLAGLLRAHGVGPDDRVALMLPNNPAAVAGFHAIIRLGAAVVPLNILLRAPEVAQRLEGSMPKVLLTTPELAGQLEPVARETNTETIASDAYGDVAADAEPVWESVPREQGDIGVVLYTSGTTGRPKGAELMHGGLSWGAQAIVDAFALTTDDVQLGSAPFSHVLGMTGVMNAQLVSGGGLALLERFEAQVALDLMAETKTTLLMAVPTMCAALVRVAEVTGQRPPLRVAHIGGAAFPVEQQREFTATFDCPVYEGWGLTEVSGPAATTPLGKTPKPGSVGFAIADSELRVVAIEDATRPLPQGETGEVQVRSTGVMRGYRDDPEATAQVLSPDGWFSTGDVGYLDADGYLFLVDRKKEMIIRGGYNVYPREVEEVLYTYPGVHEALLVGVPDESLGEEIVAMVVAKPGAQLDTEAVKQFARERVAAYKYPRYVVVVDELPKGPTGKITRRDVDREALARSLGIGAPAELKGRA